MPASSPSQTLNNLVALFLAEAIRSRRTSLSRAAEISHRVVSNINQLTSEGQALSLLTEIEKDFREVSSLKQALHFGYKLSDVKIYEAEIKDYVAKTFTRDIAASNSFLQDAASQGMTISALCLKYPDFCQYLLACPEKGQMLEQLNS